MSNDKFTKTIVGITSQKGRGVFADKSLLKGELIEISPIIVIPSSEVEFINKTVLNNYYYEWGEYGIAIALGFGSLYNHSFQPNAIYVKNFDKMVVEFLAWRDIKAEEEITVNYNGGNPEDLTPIWFETVD